MTSNVRVNSKGQIIEELDIHLEKPAEVDLEKSEVDLEKSEEPVSERPLSLQKFIYNHDIKKIDEMEILAWCEIYLAAKKKGTSLFHSSGK
jgi:hypothetical protein